MRIIAGEKKGFRLKAPPGRSTRPTLGRVRESLFMRLMPVLPGARVLDLYAGAGGLGLEALSRGSQHAVFVETARPAMGALRDNIRKLGWSGRAEVVQGDVLRWLRNGAQEFAPWDLIFLDPPYGQDLAVKTLETLSEKQQDLLAPESRIVAQVDRRDSVAEQYGSLRATNDYLYGDTRVVIFK